MTSPPRLPGSYLVMELANRCSLACVHCAVADTTHPHFDRTGTMDVDLAESLFADLRANRIGFDTLILFWLGEPLLHPEFPRVWRAAIAAAEDGCFGKVELHTNATHLSSAYTAALLNDADVPQVMHFSLDATDVDRYRTVKGKDRYDVVVRNIEHFLEEKARTGARWPRPVFQFIVGSNNVDQVSAFRDQWSRACEDAGLPHRVAAGHVPWGEDAVVFFRQLDCPTAEMQERENAVFREAMTASSGCRGGRDRPTREPGGLCRILEESGDQLGWCRHHLHPRLDPAQQRRSDHRDPVLDPVVERDHASSSDGGGRWGLWRAQALPELLHPEEPQLHGHHHG